MKRRTLIAIASSILFATAFSSTSNAAQPMMDDPIILAATGATGLYLVGNSNQNNAHQDRSHRSKKWRHRSRNKSYRTNRKRRR